MRPEINFGKVKTELKKLTDVEHLKKELHRLTTEIKNYDLQMHLTPQAKQRLKSLERRFHELRKLVLQAEKQIGSEVNRLVVTLRKASAETQAKMASMRLRKTGKKARRKSAKKVSRKKSS